MALRIEKVAEGHRVRIRLIGHVQAEQIDELKKDLAATAGQVLLDLDQVTLVDREVIRFLNCCQAQGVVLVNGSPYIEEWMRREEKEGDSMGLANAVEEKVSAADGTGIFIRSWRPNGAARAVVVIVHGFNSHGGYYLDVGTEFAASGFAVYALDLRGRGHSDGERYFVKDVHEYTGDVDLLVQLAKAREPGLPVFIFGHSAGGVISCIYTLEHQSELAGLICESFAFQVYAPDFALAVLKGLSHIAPHAHVLKLPNKDFSRDPKAVDFMNHDPFVAHEVQPTSTVAAMVRADERLKVEFPSITLPVLILHGTDDKVTKPGGSQFFYDTAGSKDKTLKLYKGHFHDLLNDTGKEQVLADVQNWIVERL